jgi:hypothetical protein
VRQLSLNGTAIHSRRCSHYKTSALSPPKWSAAIRVKQASNAHSRAVGRVGETIEQCPLTEWNNHDRFDFTNKVLSNRRLECSESRRAGQSQSKALEFEICTEPESTSASFNSLHVREMRTVHLEAHVLSMMESCVFHPMRMREDGLGELTSLTWKVDCLSVNCLGPHVPFLVNEISVGLFEQGMGNGKSRLVPRHDRGQPGPSRQQNEQPMQNTDWRTLLEHECRSSSSSPLLRPRFTALPSNGRL